MSTPRHSWLCLFITPPKAANNPKVLRQLTGEQNGGTSTQWNGTQQSTGTIAKEKTVQTDLANIRLIKKGQIERTHCAIQLQGRGLKTKDPNKGYLGGRQVRLLPGKEDEATTEGCGNLYVGSNYLGVPTSQSM